MLCPLGRHNAQPFSICTVEQLSVHVNRAALTVHGRNRRAMVVTAPEAVGIADLQIHAVGGTAETCHLPIVARMQVCSQPGCPNLTASGKCPSCKAEARKLSDSRRPNPAARGYDQAHRDDRAAYLQAFPICQHHEGCLNPSTDLDHIDGNPFNRDWSNYRGLCHSHHSQHTATKQPGGWNA